MSIKNEAKRLMESIFDLPFTVKADYSSQEPAFTISPAESRGHLFDLLISFRNKTRLEMVFKPQEFAAEMVRSMGLAEARKKAMFCAYAKQLIASKARVSMIVNGKQCDPENWKDWPIDWNKINLITTIWPIEIGEGDEPDYQGTLEKWLPQKMGMSLALLNVVATGTEREGFTEGKKLSVTVNRYERNPINRTLCLAKYGYSCQICGLNFEKTYGQIGRNYIHVHHLTPVSQMGDDYVVNPIEDMIPVCPNCHAMLHRSEPLTTPQRLKEMMEAQKEDEV